MGHKWEQEDEYLRLSTEFRRARKEGDTTTIQRLKPHLDELNQMMWQSEVRGFPELLPYSSLVEALETFCKKNGLPFPDLNDRGQNFTGKGDWKESNRFIFGVSNRKRSIQIFPIEDRNSIDVELYEGDLCYKGQTSSIEESAIVFSKWYMQDCTIEELHKQFDWVPTTPFKISGPRVRYE